MISKFSQKIKHHFQEVLQIETSVHSIAIGFAIGTFISILPTPFINIWLGLMVVMFYKKVSKISLFFALLFWNPITIAPIYFLVEKLGNYLFGTTDIVKYNIQFFDKIYNFTRRFLVADIIIAIVFSFLSYVIIFYLVKLKRRKKIDYNR